MVDLYLYDIYRQSLSLNLKISPVICNLLYNVAGSLFVHLFLHIRRCLSVWSNQNRNDIFDDILHNLDGFYGAAGPNK